MLRVLTYHRIGEAGSTPTFDPRLISATPATFERQMRHLSRHYRVVDIRDVLDAMDCGEDLPARAVLITFDDAYRDVATIAWPILRRYKLPATLFVPTAYPDQPHRAFWWDRLYRAVTFARAVHEIDTPAGTFALTTPEDRAESLRGLHLLVKAAPHDEAMALVDLVCDVLGDRKTSDNGVLGWDDLRRLAREGLTLGAHTRSHPILTRLSAKRAREEIAGSRRDLGEQTGERLPIFSYPDGGHDDAVVEIVVREGFALALTTSDGLNDLAADSHHRLRRTNITRRTSAGVFRIRMLPQFARVDAWRHRVQGVRP